MKLLVQTILLMQGAVAAAQTLPCFVDSTNHGGGLFTYTFRRGDAPYVWGLGTNLNFIGGGTIVFQSYGVLEVQEPPGWTHNISSSGRITLSVTAGPGYLDEPVVFSVLSCLTESRPYSGLDGGYIIGAVFALPGRTNYLGGGYQMFDYIGPALPRLSILPEGTNVTVRWAGEAQGLQLEESERLGVLNAWSPVTNLPAIIDGEFTVTIPATDSQRFFRLVSPCTR